MAEQIVLVCDVCGQPAAESVTMKMGRRSLVKDLCESHLSELTSGARPARPGRRRATRSVAAQRKSPRSRKKALARRPTRGARRRKRAAATE